MALRPCATPESVGLSTAGLQLAFKQFAKCVSAAGQELPGGVMVVRPRYNCWPAEKSKASQYLVLGAWGRVGGRVVGWSVVGGWLVGASCLLLARGARRLALGAPSSALCVRAAWLARPACPVAQLPSAGVAPASCELCVCVEVQRHRGSARRANPASMRPRLWRRGGVALCATLPAIDGEIAAVTQPRHAPPRCSTTARNCTAHSTGVDQTHTHTHHPATTITTP